MLKVKIINNFNFVQNNVINILFCTQLQLVKELHLLLVITIQAYRIKKKKSFIACIGKYVELLILNIKQKNM